MSPQASGKTNKLSGDLSRVLPHVQLDAAAMTALGGCGDALEALARLEQAGLLIEATRLVAPAMPPRGAGGGGGGAAGRPRHAGTRGGLVGVRLFAPHRPVRRESGGRDDGPRGGGGMGAPADRRTSARGDEAGGGGGFRQSRGVGCRRRLLERRVDGPAGSPESAAAASFHRARGRRRRRLGRRPWSGSAARGQASALPGRGQ